MADDVRRRMRDMAENLHHTMRAVFDTECYHGVYSGGPNAGERFATCEVLADRLLPIIPEPDPKRVYVDITDPTTGKYLGTADSFETGEAWAWGYLYGIGAKVNDGQKILVCAKSTGAYSIVISGGILERGEDWQAARLEASLEKATQAVQLARKALEAHVAARMAKTPKLILTATDKVAAAMEARKAGQPYKHLLPTTEELEAEQNGTSKKEEPHG